jgi:hypothetical protein
MDNLVSWCFTKSLDYGTTLCYTLLTLTGLGLRFGVL